MTLTIGVDVGGTKVAAGVVDDQGRIGARTRRDTPRSVEALLEMIADAVGELTAEQPVDAVGVGAAGFVSADRSTVQFGPNIEWRNTAVGTRLSAVTGLPVVVENDANAAAWAEFRFGAAEDVDDMALLTLGTGVGGAWVVDGRLYRGAHGLAAEIGHMRMVPGGQLCGCGQRGCLEAYASGTALLREAREAAANLPAGTRLLELAGGDPWRLDGPMVTKAAVEGDELSILLIGELGHWLGEALASLTALLDPTVFVIGGGVSAAGDLVLEPARQAMRTHLSGAGKRPEPQVRLAALGNDAGLVGAADLARV